jgi:undecaprenyl-diphosphatase
VTSILRDIPRHRHWIAAACLLAVALCVAGALATPDELTAADAALLGMVEGFTEYLPVSSTGHLLVTQRLLGIGESGVEKDAADSYAIAIQAGAILAVLLLYRERVSGITRGLVGRDDEGRRLAFVLAAAFLPAALTGLLLEDLIRDRLFGAGPVVAAWAVGGVVILVAARRLRGGVRELSDLGAVDGLIIGAAQVLALWPGTSRSLVTILAAMAIGARTRAAVEFSFLLGLLTLGAATAYEAVTSGDVMVEQFGAGTLVIGFVAAFLAAVVAIRWMVDYLNRHSLAIFGWYRLVIAGIGAVLLATGTI